VLGEVAGEREIHRGILKKRQVGYVSYLALDTWLKIFRHIRPGVYRNATARYDVVDKVAVSGSELDHAVFFPNPALEEETVQRPPQCLSARVVFEASLMITRVYAHDSQPHPNVSPQITRNPTFSARRLFTFPPLLTPTRG